METQNKSTIETITQTALNNQFECIDEQTNIPSLSIALCCKKMAANYKITGQQLDHLLEDSRGYITITLGGKILINTTDNKRLADAIVEEVKHYFGEQNNKPKNTADEALIIKRVDVWQKTFEACKQSNVKQQTDFVIERVRQLYNSETNDHFKAVIKAVENWAAAKSISPTAQPSNDEQPRPDERPDNSHFNATYTKAQLTTIFERLKNERYFHADSVLDDWLIVCGAETTNEPVKPLNWMRAQNLLGWLVYLMFENNKDDYWEITAKCFKVKGKEPKTGSMKTDVSKVNRQNKDKPKAFEDLEKLLKV